jgi:hypothetical protein
MAIAAHEPHTFSRIYLEADPFEEHLGSIALPEIIYADHAPRLYKHRLASSAICTLK